MKSPNEVQGAWETGADAWDDFVESGADYYRTEVHGPALLEACGDITGLRVLDLGCGQGYFSRELARRGATVVGIDVSSAMVANASRHEQDEPLGIKYLELDAAVAHEQWPAGFFDLITACMAVADMADPEAAMRAASHLLPVGGRMVLSLPHPFSETAYREWERDEDGAKLSLKIDGYFESGQGTTNWNMERLRYSWKTPKWRRTLSEWVTMLRDAGFVVTGLSEPRPTQEQVVRRPELDDCRRVPYFLIFDARRTE